MLSERSCTIALTGDVMLGRLVDRAIAREGYAYPWGNVVPFLRAAGLRLINLECALTAQTEPWHDGQFKAFYFRSAPEHVATLQSAGISFASLANNHAGDFGTAGLLETIAVLDRAGIAHAGAGADLAAARAPARLRLDGLRVSIIAFADYPHAWAATPTSPGINYTPISIAPDVFSTVERSLRAEREQADLLIFTIHWGPNMRERPSAAFRSFARRVIDAGADVFWGHSAHVVQGIEFYRDKLILYDTGDFIDDYAVDPDLRNDLSALFLLEVRPPARQQLRLVPVHIEHMQVNLAAGDDREWFLRRLRTLCAEMGTEVRDEGQVLTVFPHTARRETTVTRPAPS
jgi:poly-gamma-glutamate synthesis protein (capsule biosynthesis protein)